MSEFTAFLKDIEVADHREKWKAYLSGLIHVFPN